MTGDARPTLSIIIPIYNVESYLKECLASVEQQTFTDYEIILVDDGSTDGSSAIASGYAQTKPNCRYYYKENAGSGSARNFGVEKAQGTYLAFLDPDDVIERHMYERLIAALERDDSDFAICNARRFNSTSNTASWIHNLALTDLPHRTSIRECPQLIYDTTVWNKVIKRDFYVGTGITFPEKIRYQDIPVSIPLHVLADHISVVHEYAYYWRDRDGVSKSATQQTETVRNLKDRIVSMTMLDGILARVHACQQVVDAWRRKSLQHDLNLFVNQAAFLEEAEREQFRSIICDYITKNIDAHYLSEVSIICQEKTKALMEGDYERLAALREFQSNEYYRVPLTRVGGALHAKLPDDLFTSGRRDVTRELDPTTYSDFIEDVRISGSRIEIYGHLYARRQEMLPGEQTVRAYLANELTAACYDLQVEPWICSDLTRSRGTVHSNYYNCDTMYNYDGAGFKAILDLASETAQDLPSGLLVLTIEYQNPFRQGRVPMLYTSEGVRRGVANMSALHETSMATVVFDDYGAIHFLVNNDCETLRDYDYADGHFTCTLAHDVHQLVAQGRDNPSLSYAFERTGQGTFALDMSTLPSNTVFSLCSIDQMGVQSRIPLAQRDIAVLDTGAFVLIINSLREYYVKLEKKPSLACVTSITHKGSRLSFDVKRCGEIAQDEHVTEALWQIEDRRTHGWITMGSCEAVGQPEDALSFSFDFGNKRAIADLYSCFRKMRLVYRSAEGTLTACELLSIPYYKHQFATDLVTMSVFRNAEGRLMMQVSTVWPKDSNSVAKRDQLRDAALGEFAQLPIDANVVLFESWAGSDYAGNPRALYEYLNAHYPSYTCVWALHDERTPVPGAAIRVRKHTRDYYRYLCTARYLVIDDQLDTWFQKRDGQVLVQTTHGTPLKKDGLDVIRASEADADRQRLAAANAAWDYYLVQGHAFEGRYQSVYGTKATAIAVGLPRTDQLLSATKRDRAQIRQALGISDDKTVVLYAPTWRSKTTFELHLDLERLYEALGESYVVLVRLHRYEVGNATLVTDDTFVYDVSRYHAIEDLMIASDVLVSDYSSCILDYALLGKPILLYAYDYDEYATELRGLYVDYREQYPELLCTTQEELTSALLALDERRASVMQAVRAMRRAMADCEQRASSAKIVKRVMRPSKMQHTLKALLHKVRT